MLVRLKDVRRRRTARVRICGYGSLWSQENGGLGPLPSNSSVEKEQEKRQGTLLLIMHLPPIYVRLYQELRLHANHVTEDKLISLSSLSFLGGGGMVVPELNDLIQIRYLEKEWHKESKYHVKTSYNFYFYI